MLHAILICIYVIEKGIPHSIVLLFTKKNERTVSDLNRQCLMRIIPIYWGQLDQRGIKGVVEHYKILQKYILIIPNA